MFTLPVHEGGNDVAQSGQGQIDLGGLLQSGPGRLCLGLTLTSRQIYQIELALPNVLVSRRGCVHHFNVDREDGVGAGRFGVHLRCSRGSVLPAPVHQLLAFLRIVHGMQTQV